MLLLLNKKIPSKLFDLKRVHDFVGQAFGKSSAKQFYIRVSHIVAVDVTWSCSYLQAQQGEIFKKALLPGLQLDMTVS